MAQSMPLNVLQAIFAGVSVQAGQVNAVLFQQAMQKIFIFMASISFVDCGTFMVAGTCENSRRKQENEIRFIDRKEFAVVALCYQGSTSVRVAR